MKGYNPNESALMLQENNAVLMNEGNNQNFVNDTESQKQNIHQYGNKTNNNDTASQIDENMYTYEPNGYNDEKLESKKTNKKPLREKINDKAAMAEVSIDKFRDFLVGLYIKFTKKEENKIDYDAKDVINNSQEIKEVDKNKDKSIIVNTKNFDNSIFTQKELEILKSIAKERSNENMSEIKTLNPQQKLNIIDNIINTNIVEEINSEFDKAFGITIYDNENENEEAPKVSASPDVIIESPIPSPFDPVKMDERKENEQSLNKENGNIENFGEIKEDTIKIEQS